MKQMIIPFVLAAGIAFSPLAWAAAPELRSGPFEARLSALYTSRQFDSLAIEIASPKDPETQIRVVNWLRSQEEPSGRLSTFVTAMNASRLWVLSAKLPVEQRERLKESAASEYLLTKWLIRTEGFQCADAESVQSRSALIFDSAQGKEIQSFIDQSAADRLVQIRGNAVGLLVLSFSNRQNDDWLCRAGAHFSAKYAEKHPEATGTPNNDGKVVVLDDPSIEAEFVPYTEWKGKRIDALRALNSELGLPQTPSVFLERDSKMK
jgi:hypothetical protein